MPRTSNPRPISMWVLLAFIIAIGVLFYRVIEPFVLAIFIAVILAVLINPFYRWLTTKSNGHRRFAAGVTTVLLLSLVLLPIVVSVLLAGGEVMQVAELWLQRFGNENGRLPKTIAEIENTTLGKTISGYYAELSEDQKQQVSDNITKIANGTLSLLYEKTSGLLSNVLTFFISFAVMVLSLYYFLADQPTFVSRLRDYLPFDRDEIEQLTDRFQRVCRGVVLGTVVAGLVQSLFAGIAFGVIGLSNVWLLAVLTMFCSFIPFFGAGGVWISVALYLLFEGRYAAAIGLTIYGSLLISSLDNLVRAYMIGDQARLHPLVAFVTVLGALQLIGLWGIFIGPMVAAFLYSLLKIARERLWESDGNSDSGDSEQTDSDAPAAEAGT